MRRRPLALAGPPKLAKNWGGVHLIGRIRYFVCDISISCLMTGSLGCERIDLWQVARAGEYKKISVWEEIVLGS